MSHPCTVTQALRFLLMSRRVIVEGYGVAVMHGHRLLQKMFLMEQFQEMKTLLDHTDVLPEPAHYIVSLQAMMDEAWNAIHMLIKVKLHLCTIL